MDDDVRFHLRAKKIEGTVLHGGLYDLFGIFTDGTTTVEIYSAGRDSLTCIPAVPRYNLQTIL